MKLNVILYSSLVLILLMPIIILPQDNYKGKNALSVEIVITELRNNKGWINLAVFSAEDGFPNKPHKAIHKERVGIINGEGIVEIKLQHGRYAISVFHDENGNNKLDVNWLGIPKEGVAASNNAQGFMGPPKFEDAKFELMEDGIWQSLRMIYF